MKDLAITHVGGPTALIEIGPWRLLTDPTFEPPGRSYHFGWGARSKKLAGPAIQPSDIGPIDAVLLSHDHHEDNLDTAGRSMLPRVGSVITTKSGSKRLGGNSKGLAPWECTTLREQGKPSIEITATPCRHGPPLSKPIVGEVTGFALRWESNGERALWISGDTVLYDGVRQVAERIDVDTAVIHLGGVQFPHTGPFRYTMTAADAIELCAELKPERVVPIHYEGWKHFKQGRDGIEEKFASAPEQFRKSVCWLPIGERLDLGMA